MTQEQHEKLFFYLSVDLECTTIEDERREIENIVKGKPFAYYFEGTVYLADSEAQMLSMNGKTFSEESKPIPLYK